MVIGSCARSVKARIWQLKPKSSVKGALCTSVNKCYSFSKLSINGLVALRAVVDSNIVQRALYQDYFEQNK